MMLWQSVRAIWAGVCSVGAVRPPVRPWDMTVMTDDRPAIIKNGIFSGIARLLKRFRGQKSKRSKSAGRGVLVGFAIRARIKNAKLRV